MQSISRASDLISQGQPEESLELLRRVQSQSSDPHVSELASGWISVSRLMLALSDRDLGVTRRHAEALPTMLSELPFVQSLIQQMTQQEELLADFDNWEEQVFPTLMDSHPDWERIGIIVDAAWSRMRPPHPRAVTLVESVSQRLQESIATSREQNVYADIPPLLSYLQDLPEQRGIALSLRSEIAEEYHHVLTTELSDAENAIAQDDHPLAKAHLSRARQSVLPEDIFFVEQEEDSVYVMRLDRLTQHLSQRQEDMREVEGLIDQAQEALKAFDYERSVDFALGALTLAPNYKAVTDFIEMLRGRLEDKIRSSMAASRLTEALSYTEQALRLGGDDTFISLRKQIFDDQKRITNNAYKEAQDALTIFDLPQAQKAIQEGKSADAVDPRFEGLDGRLLRAEEMSNDLRPLMIEGWGHLRRRNFDGALQTFAEAASMTSDFKEPVAWRNYVDNLKDGVELALRHLDENFKPAAIKFDEAANILRWHKEERLSPLWGKRLERERRRSVYFAMRLSKEMETIDSMWREVESLEQARNLSAANQIMDQLVIRSQQFSNMVATVMEPPTGFDPTVKGSFVPTPLREKAAPTPLEDDINDAKDQHGPLEQDAAMNSGFRPFEEALPPDLSPGSSGEGKFTSQTGKPPEDTSTETWLDEALPDPAESSLKTETDGLEDSDFESLPKDDDFEMDDSAPETEIDDLTPQELPASPWSSLDSGDLPPSESETPELMIDSFEEPTTIHNPDDPVDKIVDSPPLFNPDDWLSVISSPNDNVDDAEEE